MGCRALSGASRYLPGYSAGLGPDRRRAAQGRRSGPRGTCQARPAPGRPVGGPAAGRGDHRPGRAPGRALRPVRRAPPPCGRRLIFAVNGASGSGSLLT
ncbi:hypothetical protein CA984_22875 [Streptosporangium minutum]|uniref:Uncharacterized protein n=1 Tax=Streptosporangium minutum TaxID=569862 RepID=A0A243RHK6_9ACTN|nr:hypothetical protein CA984_22875 [Streptosporangium minutum]